MTAATGDTTGDGIPDLYARDKNGVLWLVPGAGGNKIKAPVKVMTTTARFDVITGDRKSVVSGKSVSVRVDLGGRRIIKNKNTTNTIKTVICRPGSRQRTTHHH